MANNNIERQPPQLGARDPARARRHLRSQFGETSEALFLTQGFVYDSAEQAEARFKGEDPGFHYTRFGNPTDGHVRGAHAPARRRRGVPRHRDRHGGRRRRAAVATSGPATTSSPARALFGSCRYIVADAVPALRHRVDLVDGRDLDAWQKAPCEPNTKVFFFETPGQPDARDRRHRRGRRDRARGRRPASSSTTCSPRRSCRSRSSSAPTSSSIRPPSTSTARAAARRRHPRPQGVRQRSPADFLRHTGPALSPFNAWVLLKGLETLALRVRAQTETAAEDRRSPRRAAGRRRVLYLRPRRPPAGGPRQAADDRRRHRSIAFELEGRQGRRPSAR